MKREAHFVICVSNRGYAASLEWRKTYQVLPDKLGSRHNQIRVIDESGEDYLYPEEYFVPVRLPQVVERAVRRAAAWPDADRLSEVGPCSVCGSIMEPSAVAAGA